MSEVAVGVRALPSRDPALPLPRYESDGAAGLDICANLEEFLRATGLELSPGARALVPTGLVVGIPMGFEAQMRPRSGLALRHGLTLLNSPGTIDSDYRGELGVLVINHGDAPIIVEHGMRVAQLVLAPIARVRWVESDVLTETARGTAGFGSTGTGRRE